MPPSTKFSYIPLFFFIVMFYNFCYYFSRYCVASRDIQPCELILRSVTLPVNVYQGVGIKVFEMPINLKVFLKMFLKRFTLNSIVFLKLYQKIFLNVFGLNFS